MAPTADTVKQSLHALLQTCDFASTTERKIRDDLSRQLGDVSMHVGLIRSEIENYLANMRNQPAESASQPARGTKRTAEHTVCPDVAPAAKFAKNDDKYRLPLGSNKYLTVSSWKGKTYVGVREFYEKEGLLHPGGKGTNMDTELWGRFVAALPQLEQALQQENEDYCLNLSDSRRVTVVKSGRGAAMVDVREWYQKSAGETAPTKKGIRLDAGVLQLIKQHLADIAEAAKPRDTGAASSNQPQASGAPAVASTSTRAEAQEQGQGGGEQEVTVELGSKKRMRVREFNGKKLVDLREFYEKDGGMHPGKKGISLQPNEWQKLVGSQDAIQQALAAKNTSFFVPLSDRRRAAVSEYRNILYVNVREYYEKDGEMLPGQKGLSMNPDQWAVAVANFAIINSNL